MGVPWCRCRGLSRGSVLHLRALSRAVHQTRVRAHTFTHTGTHIDMHAHVHRYTHAHPHACSLPSSSSVSLTDVPGEGAWGDCFLSAPPQGQAPHHTTCHAGSVKSQNPNSTRRSSRDALVLGKAPPDFQVFAAAHRRARGSGVACLTLRASRTLGKRKENPL